MIQNPPLAASSHTLMERSAWPEVALLRDRSQAEPKKKLLDLLKGSLRIVSSEVFRHNLPQAQISALIGKALRREVALAELIYLPTPFELPSTGANPQDSVPTRPAPPPELMAQLSSLYDELQSCEPRTDYQRDRLGDLLSKIDWRSPLIRNFSAHLLGESGFIDRTGEIFGEDGEARLFILSGMKPKDFFLSLERINAGWMAWEETRENIKKRLRA